MERFSPQISQTDTDIREERSILCLSSLGTEAKTHLSLNDKTPNTDGRIELLEDNLFYSNMTVQVKTFAPKNTGKSKHDIPHAILGYAERAPMEVVVLFSVDHKNNIA